MGTKVIYRGSEHFRELNAADLKKAGVEEGFSKTIFARDEPTEIDDAAAQALIGTPDLFGKFEVAQDETEEVEAPKGKAKTGSAQESTTSTTSTTTSTPRGTASA